MKSNQPLKRKAFIHLGPPKTGSTIIQKILNHNKENFLSTGYSYIEGKEYWYNEAGQYFRAILYGKNPSENAYEKAKKSFQNQIDKMPSGHNLILSHENFIGSSNLMKFKVIYPHHRKTFLAIKRLFADLGFEVYPIFYIKVQDRFFESCYIEFINSFGILKFDEFINSIDVLDFDWRTIIDSMEEIFEDRLSIKTFEEIYLGKEQFFSSFLDCINTYDSTLNKHFSVSIPATSANEDNVSYSGIAIYFLRYLNKILKHNQLKRLRPFFKTVLNANICGKATFFSKDFRDFIHKNYIESNNHIMEKYKLKKFSKYYGLDSSSKEGRFRH